MRKHKGFTLVELVVVVMILGILAAVAAPKLLKTSGTAADNGIKQSLGVVRDAIERYAADNGGKLPGELGDQADFKADLADYLRGKFPVCPILKNSDVKITPGPGDITGGVGSEAWHYSSNNGQFIHNLDDYTNSDPALKYFEL